MYIYLCYVNIYTIIVGSFNSNFTNLENNINTLTNFYTHIPKKCLFSSNNTTSVTHEELKSAAGLIVTCEWNGILLTQMMVIQSYNYHFVFDLNGTMYTGLVKWDANTGTVACSNRSDIYIYAITVL